MRFNKWEFKLQQKINSNLQDSLREHKIRLEEALEKMKRHKPCKIF